MASPRPPAGRPGRPPSGPGAVITDLLVCENTVGRLPPRLRLVWVGMALALVGLLGLITAPRARPELTGTVVRVVDGDSIHVRLGDRTERVRYIGIDAPELNHPARGADPGGAAAAEANRRLVADRVVRLELDLEERDTHGRLLAYVYVGDTLVNGELVRLGHARVRTIRPNVRYETLLLGLQREARAERRGLWRGGGP